MYTLHECLLVQTKRLKPEQVETDTESGQQVVVGRRLQKCLRRSTQQTLPLQRTIMITSRIACYVLLVAESETLLRNKSTGSRYTELESTHQNAYTHHCRTL